MLKFNNKDLTTYNIRILNDITFSAPSQDITTNQIRGLDGDVVISNERLNSFDMSFPFVVLSKTNIEKDLQNLAEFLTSDVKWHDLEWVGSPEYVYKALYHQQLDLQRVVNKLGKGVLNFKMKPVKYLKSSLNEVTLGTGIYNPFLRAAKPIIKITGSGDMTLALGQSKINLKNVSGGIILDSQTQSAYDLTGQRPQFDKMATYDFIEIASGTHPVVKTGNITSIKIIPRFEVVAT